MVYIRALHDHHLPPVEPDDPDRMTISMFDHILREEGGADVFEVRRWTGDGDDSGDSSSMDEVDSDDEIEIE
jgi:WD repeat-containing protein 22